MSALMKRQGHILEIVSYKSRPCSSIIRLIYEEITEITEKKENNRKKRNNRNNLE